MGGHAQPVGIPSPLTRPAPFDKGPPPPPGGSGNSRIFKTEEGPQALARTVILRSRSLWAFRLPYWGSWGRAAPKSRVPLGGAQRAPPVCFANPLVRLIAPRGQSLCAPQFRCAQLWPHAHNPAPRRNSGSMIRYWANRPSALRAAVSSGTGTSTRTAGSGSGCIVLISCKTCVTDGLVSRAGSTAQYGDGAHSCEQTGPIFGHGSSPSARSVRSSARPLRTAVKKVVNERGEGGRQPGPFSRAEVAREWAATHSPSESPSPLTRPAPFDKGASTSPLRGFGGTPEF